MGGSGECDACLAADQSILAPCVGANRASSRRVQGPSRPRTLVQSRLGSKRLVRFAYASPPGPRCGRGLLLPTAHGAPAAMDRVNSRAFLSRRVLSKGDRFWSLPSESEFE